MSLWEGQDLRDGPMKSKLGGDTGQDEARRTEEAIAILRQIAGADLSSLSSAAQSFVNSLHGKVDQYEEKAIISGRQLFWLRDIRDKLLEEGKI